MAGRCSAGHRHVANNVLCNAHDLRRLGAVDRVKVRIVFQAVIACRRQDDGHALDRGGIGHGPALPLDDPVGTEVELEFTAVVGGNDIAAGALPGFLDRTPAPC